MYWLENTARCLTEHPLPLRKKKKKKVTEHISSMSWILSDYILLPLTYSNANQLNIYIYIYSFINVMCLKEYHHNLPCVSTPSGSEVWPRFN